LMNRVFDMVLSPVCAARSALPATMIASAAAVKSCATYRIDQPR
jgi:hypothetical protein